MPFRRQRTFLTAVQRLHLVAILGAIGHLGVHPGRRLAAGLMLDLLPGAAGTGRPVDLVPGRISRHIPAHLHPAGHVSHVRDQRTCVAQQPILSSIGLCRPDLQRPTVFHRVLGDAQAAGGGALGHEVIVPILRARQDLPILTILVHLGVLDDLGARGGRGLVHGQIQTALLHHQAIVAVAPHRLGTDLHGIALCIIAQAENTA